MTQIFSSVDDAKRKADPKSALEEAVRSTLDQIKHKFIVMSGKGGVGKTSTAVNLAQALAAGGSKVGLVDIDLHGPDVPQMLGLRGMLDLGADNRLIPMRFSENLSAVSVESLTPGKDDAIIWRGPVKHSVIQQFIGQVAWGPLDYLVIDAPPGTGDEPLSIAQTVKEAEAVIVTTPQEVSLSDVRKSINFCKTVKMNVLGLIENMSGFVCPHCHAAVDLFGIGGGERTAVAMQVPFLGRVPFDPELVACGDAGEPYQQKYPESPVSRAYAEIAARIRAAKPA